MKTKKALLLLSVFSTFFLTACGQSSQNSKTIDQLIQTTEKLTSVHSIATNEVSYKTTKDAETQKLTFTSDLTYIKSPYAIHLSGESTAFGNKNTQDLYVVDDSVYAKVNTSTWLQYNIAEQVKKVKDKVDIPVGKELLEAISSHKDKVKLEEKGDNYILTLSGLDDPLSPIIRNQLATTGNDTQFANLQFKDIVITLTFQKKDQSILASKVTANLQLNGAGTATLDMNATYTDFNQIKSIDLPEEAKDAPQAQPKKENTSSQEEHTSSEAESAE